MQEDNSMEISFFVFDEDGVNPTDIDISYTNPSFGTLLQEPYYYNHTPGNEGGLVVEWRASYAPALDYYGSDLITFSAIDADGNTSLNSNFQDVNANIDITVNRLNSLLAKDTVLSL